MLFVVITQVNHIDEDQLEYIHTNDFLKDQIQTSINYETDFITDYLCIGLNWQIEHHLFPDIAHEHLHLIAPIVKKFCKQHNIRYLCKKSFWSALYDYCVFLYKTPRNKQLK